MSIQGIDHIEFYVSDLRRHAAALCDQYGFAVAGRTGVTPDGGQSLLLCQGQIQILLTAGLSAGHPATRYLDRHGEGVAAIALRTDDVAAAYERALAGGAEPLEPPRFATHGGHRTGRAAVAGFGDVAHVLLERHGPEGEFAPGVMEMTSSRPHGEGLFEAIDHFAVCLPAGELGPTVERYAAAFGLNRIFDERIDVGGQTMISTVVQDSAAKVTFTLIEPDLTREPGQIDEFLAAHGGAGVQHVALLTRDIITAIATLSGRDVAFLSTPAAYYATLEDRLGALAVPPERLQRWNVLADRDPQGELFQIFSRSTHERHTFFYEVIERRGALTFGSRNIRALYEALEAERSAAGSPG